MSNLNWSGQDWQEKNDSRNAKREARYGHQNIYTHRWVRPANSDAIWREFSAEVLAARKKAGAKMIAEVKKKQAARIKRKMDAAGVSLAVRYKAGDERVSKKARLRKMSGASERRIKAIRGITTAAGSVIMLDHAPLATAQEEGKTIHAHSGYLTIGRAGQGLGRPGEKIPNGYTVQTKKGKLILFRRVGQNEIEHVATLVKSVKIRKTLGFMERIEAAIPDYLDEIDNLIYKGRR